MAWNKYLTVEVPLFINMFCAVLRGGVIANLRIYRTCYVILGFNETDCVQLGKETNQITQELEKKVQPTINDMQIAGDVISSLTLVFCLYVGIWIDKFGRKPFLLLCLAGNAASSIIYTFFVYYENVSPWWFLTCQIPQIVTGNMTTLMIILSAYVADVTTTSNRIMRMALFQIVFAAASFLGSFLIPFVVYGMGYEFTFILVSVLEIFGFFFSVFFTPESLPKEKEKFKIRNLLSYINFMDILRSTLKKRPNNGRLHVLLNIGITVLIGITVGEGSVSSLYLRAKLQWTLTKLSMLGSVTNVASMFATVVGTYVLYQKLKIKEIPITLFSCFLNGVANLLRAFATNDAYIYAAAAINLFSSLGSIMIKTLLTFMVAPEEMGKIIAMLDILLNLTGIFGNFVYPLLYKYTIEINPAYYNYLSLGINCLGALILLALINANLPYYTPPTEDKDKVESKDVNEYSVEIEKDKIREEIKETQKEK